VTKNSLSTFLRSALLATGTLRRAKQIVNASIATYSWFIRNAISWTGNYASRLAAELQNYQDVEVVHDLPPIFHYWSNKYLLPAIQPFGFTSTNEFFVNQLVRQIDEHSGQTAHFVSLGSGNCDTEVEIAHTLQKLGRNDFLIDCIDINSSMLARGRALASDFGVSHQIHFIEDDFNTWTPRQPYLAVIANQSLHHVMHLEHLLDSILKAIEPLNGVFVTSDMIGRNGHQRWPEALHIVEEFWSQLPPKYKYNRQLRRQEDRFVNWDCSLESFEGIRAQDIMPLLVERFHFDMFVPFANVISPFIDRGFGPNFDFNSEADRSFIDRVHMRDVQALIRGEIKPTQMFAVLSNDYSRPTRCPDEMTPEHCTRRP